MCGLKFCCESAAVTTADTNTATATATVETQAAGTVQQESERGTRVTEDGGRTQETKRGTQEIIGLTGRCIAYEASEDAHCGCALSFPYS